MALVLEDVVAKDAKSPYVEGPLVTWHWQKIKDKELPAAGENRVPPTKRKLALETAQLTNNPVPTKSG